MATVNKAAPAQSGDIQLAAQTYQQSMQDLSAVVSANTSESGVVILRPGQLSVVQVQAGKQYKLRKSGNPNQTPDDLIAVRHGDALHVRYADGSVVHFEDFYSTCTDSSVCSVNLAGDEAAGVTLSADALNAGPAADDGVLVYAHGNPDVLMSMAQDQPGLSAALQGVDASLGATALSYVAPSPFLGMGALALLAAGGLAAIPSAVAADSVAGAATLAQQETALKKIGAAADVNNASGSATVAALTAAEFKTAGVTGVSDGATGNLAAINSALDTAPIAAGQANTAAKLQAIVDAYKAILSSADGVAANTTTALTGEQYAAIGVSGVPTGSPTEGSALKLLDEMVDKSSAADVNTAAKVQTKADAAVHLIAAAGGTAADAAKLSVADLTALGFTNVNADNIDAVRSAIKATNPDTAIDQLSEVKTIVDAAVAGVAPEVAKISAAAGANNAGGSITPAVAALTTDDYNKASVTGVNSGNLDAINSALDTAAVTADKADTTGKVQSIVNAYAAILASADGTAANTTTAITGEQYAAIGLTGLPTGSPTDGSVLKLLDEVVDKSAATAVSSAGKLQAMADAAAHVLTAAGGTPADIAKLTVADLQALGYTAVTADNIVAVRAAIQATTPDSAIDQAGELSTIVGNAIAGVATELAKISAAAGANNASGTSTPAVAALVADEFAKANVTGVNAGNVAAINSALDTTAVTAAKADTTAKVQDIVNAYTAILASADGTAANTSIALTGEQYAAIGVSGVPAGSPTDGSALKLLDEVVDKSVATTVDSAGELQAMADGAAHVLAAAGGAAADAAKLTVADLQALGFTNVNSGNIVAIRAAIQATTPDSSIDQVGELSSVIATAIGGIATELTKISTAASANNAGGASGVLPLSATDYIAASVSGVDSGNIVAINSALDSASVTADKADTTAEVQAIVDAYTAIIGAANSTAGSTPITADQFTLVGVTGVSGSPATEGTAIKLLDDVIDTSAPAAVATETLLQNMATAANHLMEAAGGTAAQAANLTAADLQALGISMGTLDIAAVRAALQSVTTDASVDTKSELQSFVSHIVAPEPILSTTLGGVTDLDVTSNLVFTSSVAVNVGTGKIHITDLGGTGYHGDVNNNSVDIDMATAISSGLVTLDASRTKITINPKWDLDLSSNYSISIDAGAFVDPTNGHLSQAVAALNFSTVAPGTRVAGHAVALDASVSHTMDSTGSLVVSTAWLDVEGLGNITGVVTQLGDLSTGSYTLVAKNYATRPGGPNGDQSDGIRLADTNVGVTNFGANDYIYFDSQVNDISMQAFDSAAVGMVQGDTFGGAAGQNAMDMATASGLSPQAAGARIMLGLEGNTTGKQYNTINQDGVNHGWATDWHAASQPVLMG
jgi:hypothetical protein